MSLNLMFFKRSLVIATVLTLSLSGCAVVTDLLPQRTEKNFLTGMPVTNGPVLVVKIDDTTQAHPQIGLEDADVAGIKINKGTIVIVPIYAIHRNPDYWDQPNAFDPNRFSNLDMVAKQNRFHYLPFGGGARLCLRQAFLVAEAVTLVARIIQSL